MENNSGVQLKAMHYLSSSLIRSCVFLFVCEGAMMMLLLVSFSAIDLIQKQFF
jgi:hypothetical protein